MIRKGDKGLKTVKRITQGAVDIMIKKPNIILNYIKYMGSIDRVDRGMKISFVNSYLLHKLEKTKRDE